jgi:hypothetical protein
MAIAADPPALEDHYRPDMPAGFPISITAAEQLAIIEMDGTR